MGICLAVVTANLVTQDYTIAGILMVTIIGMGLNVLVLSANGWRMPVRNRDIDTPRHITLGPEHRYPWLADRLPLAGLRASMGDVLIVLGIAASWVYLLLQVLLG